MGIRSANQHPGSRLEEDVNGIRSADVGRRAAGQPAGSEAYANYADPVKPRAPRGNDLLKAAGLKVVAK